MKNEAEKMKEIRDLAVELGISGPDPSREDIERLTREALAREIFDDEDKETFKFRGVELAMEEALEELVRKGEAIREVVDGETYYRMVQPREVAG